MASIAGKGTTLMPTLTLKYVPKLSINLLSIPKLTTDLNCKVVFYPNYCVFQKLVTGKTIGLAKERECLYILDICGGGHGHQLPISQLSEKLSINQY